MELALACASHTPLLFEEELASVQVCNTVRQSFAKMAEFIEEFDPDHIIQFSPDHYHGFYYKLMPAFCLGAAATSCGDWATRGGPLRVDEEFALEVFAAIREADIDAALSYDMTVDHGFVQIWETMFGQFDRYPIVPIFVNSISHPLPSYRRARMLGEAVGRFAMRSGKRILFAASGGLSHDPIVPDIRTASEEVRARLLGKVDGEGNHQAKREAQVREAGRLAMSGKGPVRPLNPQWDNWFLDALASADWGALDALDPQSVDAVAGSGANEVLSWVAATAALGAAGEFSMVQRDYLAIDGWIAGFGHFTALSHQAKSA